MLDKISNQTPKLWKGEPSIERLFKGSKKYDVIREGKYPISIVVNRYGKITHAMCDLKKYIGKNLNVLIKIEKPVLDLKVEL